MEKLNAQIKNLKYYDEDYISINFDMKFQGSLLNEINNYLREIGEFSFLYKNEFLITQESALFHIMIKYVDIGFNK